MTPVQRTLLIILAFVAVSVGSFIWYIATWDPAENDPLSVLIPQFHQFIWADFQSAASHVWEQTT
ncbi:MAG: hypothetical protein AAGA38_04790 [Pseudomonadota bacterium]